MSRGCLSCYPRCFRMSRNACCLRATRDIIAPWSHHDAQRKESHNKVFACIFQLSILAGVVHSRRRYTRRRRFENPAAQSRSMGVFAWPYIGHLQYGRISVTCSTRGFDPRALLADPIRDRLLAVLGGLTHELCSWIQSAIGCRIGQYSGTSVRDRLHSNAVLGDFSPRSAA